MSARELSDAHRALLEASAIRAEMITARCYWTAERKVDLQSLGFAAYQRNVPALVLPVHSVTGEIVNYQARADTPRIDAERGRPIKYETIANARMALDVPPCCRAALGDPERELWITEGVKKGDALASTGVCALALLGVWNWRGENGRGGKTALPDWEAVALNDRRVLLAFDSDVIDKPAVYAALERLAALLASRGAKVGVVYLPARDDGAKVGVDDFLGGGGTVAQLRALAEDELRPPPSREPERRAPVETWRLLRYVSNLLDRHVRLPGEHERTALALWTLHTWALDAAHVTPYMLVSSPTKRSGKTRLLEVLELAAREPVRAASITPASLYQAIEYLRPTLLVDEIDAIFASSRASERTEELRGVLNAGNARGSFVLRGTQDGTPARFSIFCPKVLAGIDNGRLPDTIRDRAIVVAMERKRRGDDVERLRPAELNGEIEELRARLDDWGHAHTAQLAGFRGDVIPEIGDRLDEAWEPLRAIAELAGDPWPARARAAAVALAGKTEEDGQDVGLILLGALRAMFGDELAMASKAICSKLNADDETPFGAMRGGLGIDARGLARVLRPYGIRPRKVRVGAETPWGYRCDRFADAWERYLPAGDTRTTGPALEPAQAEHPAHPAPHAASDVPDVPDVPDNPQGNARAPVSTFPGARPEPIPGQLSFDASPNGDGPEHVSPATGRRCVERDGLNGRSAWFDAETGERVAGPGERTLVELSNAELAAAFAGSEWVDGDEPTHAYLTSAEVAAWLGVSLQRLTGMVRKGELAPVIHAGTGRRHCWLVADLRALKPDGELPEPTDGFLTAAEHERAERYRERWPWLREGVSS